MTIIILSVREKLLYTLYCYSNKFTGCLSASYSSIYLFAIPFDKEIHFSKIIRFLLNVVVKVRKYVVSIFLGIFIDLHQITLVILV